jgi:hypothetical protein
MKTPQGKSEGGMAMKRRGEDGQALFIVAGGLTVLMFAAGLGVDMGYLRYEKRRQQAAADSAAIAAASEINYGDVTQAAQTDGASNGYTNGSNNVTVKVYSPPNDGPNTGVAGYVEVLVTKIYPTFFMKVAGSTFANATITARAVAYAGAGGSACVYALDPTAAGVTLSGSGQIVAPHCGVIVDSKSSTAVSMSGSAAIQVKYVGIVGDDSVSGSATISPPPVLGIVPASDPLAYLDNSKPTISSFCSPGSTLSYSTGVTKTVTPGSSCYNVSVSGSNNNITLSAGNYGDVTVSGGPNTVTLGSGSYGYVNVSGGSGTVTYSPGQYGYINGSGGGNNQIFNPGVYVITGSQGVNLSGGNGLSGTGVTFYLGPHAGAVNISGSTSTSLAAPTSGSFDGILIFQDPGDTSAANISGNAGTILDGAIYFPTAQLTMSGSSSFSFGLSAYTILVAYDMVISGSGSVEINNNYAGLAGGSPIKNAALGE